MLGVALPLAAADLVAKSRVPTEQWAYHERSLGWLAFSVALFGAMIAVTRVPSALVALAAGLLSAGLLGNGLSAAWNGMEVPNPFVVVGERGVLAFNLADAFVLAGTFMLVVVIGVWLIRNRDLIPPPSELRATRGRAFRRLFEEERQ